MLILIGIIAYTRLAVREYPNIDPPIVSVRTVYPGATEEDCLPVLERASGLRGGRDFTVGYSPERINPGDREHRAALHLRVLDSGTSQSAPVP